MTDADQIRNLLAHFCQCLDDRRFVEWSETFAEDGAFGERSGRATILRWIQGAELATQPELRRKHAVMNSIVEVDGETATASSDLVMYDWRGEGPWTVRIGRYTDMLARQPDGAWRFTRRRLDWLT